MKELCKETAGSNPDQSCVQQAAEHQKGKGFSESYEQTGLSVGGRHAHEGKQADKSQRDLLLLP